MPSDAFRRLFLAAVWQDQQESGGTARGAVVAERFFDKGGSWEELVEMVRQCADRGWLSTSTDFQRLHLTNEGLAFMGAPAIDPNR